MFHVLALMCIEYVGLLGKEKELLSPKAHSGRESPLLLKGECTSGISISRFLVTFIYLCAWGWARAPTTLKWRSEDDFGESVFSRRYLWVLMTKLGCQARTASTFIC